jgi:hypothetical protein
MSQVEITFEMSEIIADRIAAFPRDAFVVPECGALPLYADMRGVIGIRPDGTLVEWSHDGGGRDARPVEDRIWVLIALVAAARRYPEFQKLLPVRGPGAIDCDCRRTPTCISGLIYCSRCGGMGWLAAGNSRPVAWPDRPRQVSPLIGLVLVALAILSFLGALVVLFGASRAWVGNALALIVLGILSLVLAARGVGRRRPGGRKVAQSPTFNADDPEVAALPPTSMTQISERIRLAREAQRRAED